MFKKLKLFLLLIILIDKINIFFLYILLYYNVYKYITKLCILNLDVY